MSKREKVQSVLGILLTIALVIAIGVAVKRCDFLPGLIFWIVAEIAVFADGYTIYNMVML